MFDNCVAYACEDSKVLMKLPLIEEEVFLTRGGGLLIVKGFEG